MALSWKRMAAALVAFVCAAVLALSLVSCGQSQSQTETTENESDQSTTSTEQVELADTNIIGLKGPTGIGMVKMMDDASAQSDSPFHFSLAASPDEATAAVLNGEADIAMIPTNLASVLYNRTEGGVKMIAINCLGNLYIVENGDTVNSMEDLEGQTIYATGQGANPEYILNHLLNQAGLTPGENVDVEYLSEHAELATLVASGERNIAMLPEPFVATVTSKNPDVRIALNLNEVWEGANEGGMTMGCAIVNTEFADAHPETVQAFLDQLKESIQYCQDDVAGAAELCVKYEIMADAKVAEKAIPNCAITYIAGADMEPAIADFFQVLYNANPKSLGGAIPDLDFYYQG